MKQSKLPEKFKNLNWTLISNLASCISFFIISITLIILRAFGLIKISWLWVILPIGVPILLSVLISLSVIFYLIYDMIKNGAFLNFLGDEIERRK
jgi:hypothetical protein